MTHYTRFFATLNGEIRISIVGFAEAYNRCEISP